MENKEVKKKVGRPKDKFSTISKTYRFFDVDIDYMLNSGQTPKHIFRLGCIAHRDNPQLIARIKELEQGNDKLQKKLQSVSMALSEKMDKERS